MTSQIAKFMGPTWGPLGSCRPQMGPILTPWTLLSGFLLNLIPHIRWHFLGVQLNTHCHRSIRQDVSWHYLKPPLNTNFLPQINELLAKHVSVSLDIAKYQIVCWNYLIILTLVYQRDVHQLDLKPRLGGMSWANFCDWLHLKSPTFGAAGDENVDKGTVFSFQSLHPGITGFASSLKFPLSSLSRMYRAKCISYLVTGVECALAGALIPRCLKSV